MYRPLPDCVTIKDSLIDGLGLFATKDIPKGTYLGISHIYVDDNITKDNWVRLPLGGFYNHSDTPNCRNENMHFYLELYTIEDIKTGEELTCEYKLYNPTT
jgi:SET domain-containing protein